MMSKYKEIVLETLQEAKQVGTLYHNTPALKEILESNELIGYYSVGLSFDTKEGWFNDRDWHQNSYYTLIFDGDKLSENYKVLPYSNFPDLSRDNDKIDPYGEHETIIVPNNIPKGIDIYDYIEENDLIIPNINKYIKGILVLPSIFKSAILT